MDDVDAWEFYPQNRWIFNKLEVALKLGHDSGPACVPISKKGKYIVRPIYNLYGMGIGAKIIELDPETDSQAIRDHAYLSPGYFWCEYFKGDHVSVDYLKLPNFRWEPHNAVLGLVSDSNLRKFKSWRRVPIPKHCEFLPSWIPTDVKDLNIEWRGKNIIEIHLRTGNDFMHNTVIGDILYPVFKGYEKRSGEFVENEKPEADYSASGILSEIREGYVRDKI